MSFEDDAYWESEYTDRSTARNAVSRRPAPPVDELAVRRRRRHGRYRQPPRPDGGVQKGFDTERPGWLDDPDFVPTDVSGPDVTGHDSAVLDFNRPELGTAFDAPGRRWTDGGEIPRVGDDDRDEEIDEPYDHRAGMDRRPTAALAIRTAPVSPATAAATSPVPPPLTAATSPVPPPPTAATASVQPATAAATASVPPPLTAIALISQPVPPAGFLPPVQRAPADAALPSPPDTLQESTPDTRSRRDADADADADEVSSWFATWHRGSAAPETTGRVDDQAVGIPETQPAPALAPEDLRAVRWRLDGATLCEVVDERDALRELGNRLDGPLAEETDHVRRAGLLSLRAEVYRLIGELGMAAAASRLALAHAESARDVHAIVIAQAELAHVLRLRGHHAEADRLLEEAAGSEAPELLRSVVHEYAGRSCFDQGRHMEALNHFARAIRLGAPDDLDLVERIDVCLEAVHIHVLRDGWGPYPRLRREILGADRPSAPTAPSR